VENFFKELDESIVSGNAVLFRQNILFAKELIEKKINIEMETENIAKFENMLLTSINTAYSLLKLTQIKHELNKNLSFRGLRDMDS